MSHELHVFGFMGSVVCYQDMPLAEAAQHYIDNECDGEGMSVQSCIDQYHLETFQHDGIFAGYMVNEYQRQ